MGLFKSTTAEKLVQLDDRLSDIIVEKGRVEHEIERCGRELAEELTKIEGWKSMVKNCLPQYEQQPSYFFGWCSYKVINNELHILKGYANDDAYTVLVIDLTTPLEEQVKMAMHQDGVKKNLTEQRKTAERYERDMEVTWGWRNRRLKNGKRKSK